MSKKEKEHSVSSQETHKMLKTIIYQLDRLIACLEKRLSGEVIHDFDSAEYIKQKGGS